MPQSCTFFLLLGFIVRQKTKQRAEWKKCWSSKTTSIYFLSDMNINCDAVRRDWTRGCSNALTRECVYTPCIENENIYSECVRRQGNGYWRERRKKNHRWRRTMCRNECFTNHSLAHRQYQDWKIDFRTRTREFSLLSRSLHPKEGNEGRERRVNWWMRHLNSVLYASIEETARNHLLNVPIRLKYGASLLSYMPNFIA